MKGLGGSRPPSRNRRDDRFQEQGYSRTGYVWQQREELVLACFP